MSHMGLTHDSKPSKLRLETGRVSGQVMREAQKGGIDMYPKCIYVL